MHVCLCVCVRVCVRACLCVCIRLCRTYIRAHMCVCAACMHAGMYVCVCAFNTRCVKMYVIIRYHSLKFTWKRSETYWMVSMTAI